MKNHLLYTFYLATALFCSTLQTSAQTPDWVWARTGVGFRVPYTFADAQGNLYATGSFSGTVTIGDTTLQNSNQNGSHWDMLVVKYNTHGDIIWARASTGTAGEEGLAVTTDKSGNVYVAGQYNSYPMSFPTESGDITLEPTGTNDVFIVKYTSSGKVEWAHSAKGNGMDFVYSLTTDTVGNVYMTGAFSSSTLTFGPHTLTRTGTEARNGYVVKYNTEGNEIWAKSFEGNLMPPSGGQILESTNKIKADKDGNICITGLFTSPTISFGDITLANNNGPTPFGGLISAMFIVKYDTDGNELWAKTAQGDDKNSGNSVAMDSEGNIYVAGRFIGGSIVFDNTKILNTPNSEPSNGEFFITKYSHDGNLEWVKTGGGTSEESPTSIALDSNNNIYVTGHFFSAESRFGAVTLYNAKSTNNSKDVFIAKYNPTGQVIWAKSLGSFIATSLSISSDNDGFVYISGTFYPGSLTFGGTTLEGNFGTDMFIAKLSNIITSVTEEPAELQNVTIAPNPVHKIFRVMTNEPAKWNVSVYNVAGEKVYTSFFTDTQTIDLSGQVKGTYIYKLQKDNKFVKTGKIILE